MTANTWIHSQQISDSTNISYKELTEVAKFVVFKDSATNIFNQFRVELQLKDSIISIKDLKIREYNIMIPNLKSVSKNKDSIINNKSSLLEISDIKLKSQKSKKWVWLGGGALVGMVLSLLLGS